jgi:hypothetical protein
MPFVTKLCAVTKLGDLTVHCTQYTIHCTNIYLAPFEFCGRIFSKWPSIRKSPIPLPNTPSSILFIYQCLHIVFIRTLLKD